MDGFEKKKVKQIPNKVKARKNLSKNVREKSGPICWDLKTYKKLQTYWIGKHLWQHYLGEAN